MTRRTPHILVIHGPNLQRLGDCPVRTYGRVSLPAINRQLTLAATQLGATMSTYQSNHEGELVNAIEAAHEPYDALVINPAAYTHTSVAIRDAIEAANIPAVEVHLSNIAARGSFRHTSLSAPVCHGQISGFGPHSYILGLRAAIVLCQPRSKQQPA